MPEPTYRIAQALHARRAAVGLPKYGQHLTAASSGCMLVHALEESADKTNYLIAEVQRRKNLIETLYRLADEMWEGKATTWARQIEKLADLLGGRAALARYDEILGGGTVAENATVAPLPKDADAEAALAAVWRDEAEATIERMHGPKLDPRDEALRVAEEALAAVCIHLSRPNVSLSAKENHLLNLTCDALAAMWGAR
jgi:hypothetical protein